MLLETEDRYVFYGDNEAIYGVRCSFERYKMSLLIGLSGSGKSTYCCCLYRMNDNIERLRVSGKMLYRNIDMYSELVDVYESCKHIGMVF